MDNRPIEDLDKLIGDIPSAIAILDRFLQDAEILTLTGKNYRLKGRATKKASSARLQQRNPTQKNSAPARQKGAPFLETQTTSALPSSQNRPSVPRLTATK